MATFTYEARRADGTAVSGTLPAEDERAALLALDRQGLLPLSLEEAKAGVVKSKGFDASQLFGPRRINAETASRMARELADLSQAGVPILQALEALCREPAGGDEGVLWGAKESKDDARARTLLEDVRRDVAQGASLHEALRRREELLGSTAASLIRAGEAGGFLDAALRRVATFAEREQTLKKRVQGALAYPAILSVISAGAVIFLLVWVVPRFSSVYDDLGGALPWPTRVLITVGDLLKHWWWTIPLVVGAAVVAFRRWQSTPEGRRTFDRLLLRVPLLRAVVAQASLARFCRTLGTLLASGVPILEALEISREAAGNSEFQARLGEVIAPMREGAELVRPLRATRLFPPQVLEMVQVGQETGTLPDVLERAGDRADEEVDTALKAAVTVLEPLLLVMVAGVVFFVVLAALLPVFSLNALIH